MDLLEAAIVRAKREDDPYVEGVHTVEEKLDEGLDLSFYEFHNVEFERCVLSGVVFTKASFYDCTFEGCDLSNAVFNEAYFSRCRFVGCKLEGAQFNKAFSAPNTGHAYE